MGGENGLAYLWIGPQLSVLLASPSTSKTNKQVPAFSTLQQKILSLYGQKHEGYVEKGNKQKTKETLKEKESKLFNAPNQLELGEGLMEETASRGQKRSKEVNHANRKSSKEDITENINLSGSTHSASGSMHHRRKRAKREPRDTDSYEQGEGSDTSTIEVKEDDTSDDMDSEKSISDPEERIEEKALSHLLHMVTQEENLNDKIGSIEEKVIGGSGTESNEELRVNNN